MFVAKLFNNDFRRFFCSVAPSTSDFTSLPNRKSIADKSFERANQWNQNVINRERLNSQRSQPITNVNDADRRYLQVAVIGMPNSGKSTLVNALVGSDICANSPKINTTTKNAMGFFTDENKQVVLVDTPGFLRTTDIKKAKYSVKSSPTMITDPEKSLKKVDLIMCVVDVRYEGRMDNRYREAELHPRILCLLNKYEPMKSIVVLNKIDLLRSREQVIEITKRITGGQLDGRPIEAIEENKITVTPKDRSQFGVPLTSDYDKILTCADSPMIDENKAKKIQKIKAFLRDMPLHKVSDRNIKLVYHGRDGYPNFSEVFYTSAVKGHGIDNLKRYLLESCKPGRWRFEEQINDDLPTDLVPSEIAINAIRASVLTFLPSYLPYKMPIMMTMAERDSESGIYKFSFDLLCDSPGQMSIVLGFKGNRIKEIAANCRQSLRNALANDVKCHLVVKLDPKFQWRHAIKKENKKFIYEANKHNEMEIEM